MAFGFFGNKNNNPTPPAPSTPPVPPSSVPTPPSAPKPSLAPAPNAVTDLTPPTPTPPSPSVTMNMPGVSNPSPTTPGNLEKIKAEELALPSIPATQESPPTIDLESLLNQSASKTTPLVTSPPPLPTPSSIPSSSSTIKVDELGIGGMEIDNPSPGATHSSIVNTTPTPPVLTPEPEPTKAVMPEATLPSLQEEPSTEIGKEEEQKPEITIPEPTPAEEEIQSNFSAEAKEQVEKILEHDIEGDEAEITEMETTLAETEQVLKTDRAELAKIQNDIKEQEAKVAAQEEKMKALRQDVQARRKRLAEILKEI